MLKLNTLLSILLAGTIVIALCRCSDDQDPLPAYSIELCELLTDGSGRVVALCRDGGDTLSAQLSTTPLRPDTAYRCLATYVAQPDGSLLIRGSQLAIAPALLPPTPNSTQSQSTPIELLSIWRTPRYINFRAKVGKSGTRPHRYAFRMATLTNNPNGSTTQTIVLHHDAKGDSPNYAEEYYFSCPLYTLASTLRHNTDSVAILIATPTGDYRFATPF